MRIRPSPSSAACVIVLAALAIANAASAQDKPAPTAPPAERGAAKPSTTAVPSTDPCAQELAEFTAEQATAAITEFRAKWRAAKTPAEKVTALNTLASGRHTTVADELAKAAKDKPAEAANRAVLLLGTQRGCGAEKYLLPMCKYVRNFDEMRGRAALHSLGWVGYGKDGYKILEDLFWKCSAAEVRAEIAFAWGKQKEKRAFSILAELIDLPRPTDPNDPNNPPASYWDSIGKQWEILKTPVGEALESICGKKIFNKAAAERWFEETGKKQGFKLESVSAVWKA